MASQAEYKTEENNSQDGETKIVTISALFGWNDWEHFVQSMPPYGHQIMGFGTGALLPTKHIWIPLGLFLAYEFIEQQQNPGEPVSGVCVGTQCPRNVDIGEFITWVMIGLLTKEAYKEYK